MLNLHVVVLAGGSGTRFWPKSRLAFPKQLCKIADPDREMILTTLDRIQNLVPAERRMIVTHQAQSAQTKNIVGDEVRVILAEPAARNTLPALTLAALEIRSRDPSEQAVMVSLHADSVIDDTDKFLFCLRQAAELAGSDRLGLIGIKPMHPETGYGYIERGEPISGFPNCYLVKRFREKPDLKTAEKFLAQGGFYWNSGLFVWRISTFLAAVKKFAPDTYEALSSLYTQGSLDSSRLASVYAGLEKLSVDEAILEKAENIGVVEASFGWQDVGSWDALDTVLPPDDQGNRHTGETIFIDSQNTTVDTDGPLVAAIGLQGMVVVHHKGAILVCPKERAQEVKKVVEQLADRGRPDLQ